MKQPREVKHLQVPAFRRKVVYIRKKITIITGKMNNLTKLVAKNCKIVKKKSKKWSQNFFLDIARICINTFKRV